MLASTLPRLRCPACASPLELLSTPKTRAALDDIRSGQLGCGSCRAVYLILAGIALLVEDSEAYLQAHAKGIGKVVPDSEIPEVFRDAYLEARAELMTEHIEEDLEAERVTALYLMTHYLTADSKPEWWKPVTGEPASPLIDALIREHWDQGPSSRIKEWLPDLVGSGRRFKAAVELGCGVGGLHHVLKSHCDFYLGADSSFASIALARHLALGAPYPGPLRVPEDLLRGSVSREITLPTAPRPDGGCDFVVMEMSSPALATGWDLSLSLNMIDMLDEPEGLPRLQWGLLENDGVAIQSGPYIWHEAIARALREKLPTELHGSSARAVEWLYRRAGFRIERHEDHRPWLFFKHLRQLEIYSVHLLAARKKSGRSD